MKNTGLDTQFLKMAIDLSERHSNAGHGGPFGAVLVKGGQVISRGWNKVLASKDPTAHAEITAIRSAARKLGSFALNGCVLYSSCEPCPMCLAAIYWARIKRVVYAAGRTDAAKIGFDDAFFYTQINLPPGRRTLPMIQQMRGEAAQVMLAWARKPGHRLY
jgi:guanine deaminase